MIRQETPIGSSNWVFLLQELQNLKGVIVNLKQTILQKDSDIKRLEDFLADGKRLKNNADRKYQDEETMFMAAQKRSKEGSAKIELLRSRLSLAEKVSPFGRLVNLSRQAFDREAEWFFSNVDRSIDKTTETSP